MSAMDVLRGNIDKIEELTAAALKGLPDALPVGSGVHWDHGKHVRRGTVDMHAKFGSPRVRVTLQSGNFKWLDVTQLHEYQRAETPVPEEQESK